MSPELSIYELVFQDIAMKILEHNYRNQDLFGYCGQVLTDLRKATSDKERSKIVAKAQKLQRLFEKHKDVGKNMTAGVLDNITVVFSIASGLDKLLKQDLITPEEYDRVYQMSFASVEDLTLALEITRNLCEQHGMLTPRLRYCKIKTAEDEGVH